MKKTYIKNLVWFFIIAAVLMASAFYKIKLNNEKVSSEKDFEESVLNNKSIVRVWLPGDNTTSTRRYQIQKFNQNHDDIYIMFNTYGNDYNNLLELSLAADKGPDIMAYTSLGLINKGQIMNLEKSGINLDNFDPENFIYFIDTPIGVRIFENNVKFIWNKEIFKKAGLNPERGPRTWDEVMSYSEKIKEYDEDIVPFAFPFSNYEDFKLSVGEPSVSAGSIYTSFWDYEDQKYEFENSNRILSLYNEMYSSNFIDEEFFTKGRKDLRKDFYFGNTAMMISSFEDKWYFSNEIPLTFDLGISNLPVFNYYDEVKYYYMTGSNFLCINNAMVSKTEKEQNAIREVYNWFISEEVNRELLSKNLINSPLISDTSFKNYEYEEYNDNYKFKVETKDPSIFVTSVNNSKTLELASEAIIGEKTIEEVIGILNENFKEYYNNIRYDKNIFSESEK
ncbi:ABC transporter substrate-binding protein [Clostridium grantii]|uniref:ABC-type glycerol-3-phosphate transport system, substrate-binding protein n=1 Tax=Clostridium grantii DSM 8605 TaxID=1121316 RepID=A0A1M5SLV4_9CLOT|nr:ABC transporter substrate-binding protein [Clostridium grantii]SHH39485.1 ABC-type glycerol-3-phosphate transport system, substrate-binding protein [Clostridium grantii DSM 8605]